MTMTEHKFTDEDIIKALECCANADCLNCPRWSEEWSSGMCSDFLPSVLDLIKRQKAEIANLINAVDNSTKEFLKLHDEYQEQKAEVAFWMDSAANAKREAVKDFADRLKAYYRSLEGSFTVAPVVEYHIDQIQKEMLGDQD